MNQALFERLVIDDVEEISGTFKAPFDLLMEAAGIEPTVTVSKGASNKPRGPLVRPRGLSIESLVEPGGLEPPT
jgi:hypothetical protein